MDLIRMLLKSEPKGPFGCLESGDGSEHVRHASVVDWFSREDRQIIERVWSGREADALLSDAQGREIYLFEYCPRGTSRSGRYYGYTYRHAPLPNPAGFGPGRRAKSRPRRHIAVVGASVLLLFLAGAGASLVRRPMISAEARNQGPASPSVKRDDTTHVSIHVEAAAIPNDDDAEELSCLNRSID
jgi:hypothetical protein